VGGVATGLTGLEFTQPNDAEFRWLSLLSAEVRKQRHKDRREHCKTPRWQCWFCGSQPPQWKWKFGGNYNTSSSLYSLLVKCEMWRCGIVNVATGKLCHKSAEVTHVLITVANPNPNINRNNPNLTNPIYPPNWPSSWCLYPTFTCHHTTSLHSHIFTGPVLFCLLLSTSVMRHMCNVTHQGDTWQASRVMSR